ncbi:MAG: lysoplasmalogenase family protein [Symbiopectobacterium sp.]
MLWSFIAILFSCTALRLCQLPFWPGWQRCLFKPITITLLLALAWQTPLMSVTGYFIVLGLLAATLAADVFLLPIQRMLFAIGAYSSCHLLYTIGFLVTKASLTFLSIAAVAVGDYCDTARHPVVTARHPTLTGRSIYRNECGHGVNCRGTVFCT